MQSSLYKQSISVPRPVNEKEGLKRGNQAMQDSVIDSILNPAKKTLDNTDSKANKANYTKAQKGKMKKSRSFLAKRMEKR